MVTWQAAKIEYSKDPELQQKVETACLGLPNWVAKHFQEISDENKRLIADFVNNCAIQENVRASTRKSYVTILYYLIKDCSSQDEDGKLKDIPLDKLTSTAILSHLASFRKTPIVDPDEKWINTHNTAAAIILKFYKWLNAPDKPAEDRERPPLLKDLVFYKRKEKTSVQAKDLWTPEEDQLFLKFCEDPRVALYHTMSRDTSGRPHELLNLRVGDVKVKQAPNGQMYAEVEIGRGGKTKSRTVPLIMSLPYFRAWLQRHPQGSNPQAFLFPSMHKALKYRNVPIQVHTLSRMYYMAKTRDFPKLLDRPDVTPEEKFRIKEMLQKPWHPYLRRHISLTEMAKLLPNEYSLRLHAGWTKSSKMVEIYTHELGGESSKAILQAMGMMPKSDDIDVVMPKHCPHCNEPNKPDARFCANEICGLALTPEAYQEIKQREKEKDKKLEEVWQALYKQGLIKKE